MLEGNGRAAFCGQIPDRYPGSVISHSILDPALIIGLGNPGREYVGNRHNVGSMVIDEIASRCSVSFRSHKARASVAEARLGVLPGGKPGPRIVAARPLAYMNESGAPTAALAAFFSVAPTSVIVVHDDLETPFGQVRLRRGGSEAGHNGLRSISSALRTRDYVRVRVGIGRPPGKQSPGDFVLRDFNAAERKELPFVLGDAVDVIEELVLHGVPGEGSQ
ncbi:aminoacyl-tRNA hydrolase [Austwickia chelonae]|uniref:aminoacyl-tRNA hydrolase n=1 Tax=Austwickia chelonae TaxID=100225 RepID=UPI003D32080B